ncbi:hypothetical protein NKH18_31065 [Streptomyces sp. M10(2022)]
MTAAAATAGWRRAGLAGAAIGVIAAGAAAGVAVERLTVGRGMRKKARLALDASGPYGSCAGSRAGRWPTTAPSCTTRSTRSKRSPPGAGRAGRRARRRRLFGRKMPAAVTVVFSHGYCLSQDSWHFQRAALRGLVRTVHWDQQPRPLRARPGTGRACRSVSTSSAGI